MNRQSADLWLDNHLPKIAINDRPGFFILMRLRTNKQKLRKLALTTLSESAMIRELMLEDVRRRGKGMVERKVIVIR